MQAQLFNASKWSNPVNTLGIVIDWTCIVDSYLPICANGLTLREYNF